MYKEEIFEKETVADLLKKMPETPPKMWSVEDFLILLDHMGLGIYKSIFRMEKIDGSVFFDLKQNDFKDMKLSHFRKIEIWIKDLLEVQNKRQKVSVASDKKYDKKGFDFKQNNKSLISSDPKKLKTHEKLKFDTEEDDLIKEQQFEIFNFDEILKSTLISRDSSSLRSTNSQEEEEKKPKKTKKELLMNEESDLYSTQEFLTTKKTVKQIEDESMHSLTESGGHIGRSRVNEIRIIDLEVTKMHANIIYSEGNYYISDNKSKNGSYVLISPDLSNRKLEINSILEIGDFCIKICEFSEKCAVFELNNIDDDIDDETCKQEEIIPFHQDKIVGFTIDDSIQKGFRFVQGNKNCEIVLKYTDEQMFLNILEKGKKRKIWLKIPSETWFPLYKDLIFRISSHEFQVFNMENFKLPSKCKCGRYKNVIYPKCHHMVNCMDCYRTGKKKINKCDKCQINIDIVEKIDLFLII